MKPSFAKAMEGKGGDTYEGTTHGFISFSNSWSVKLGLLGFFQYNLVESLLGAGGLTTVVYSLVGVAAVVEVVTHKANCKLCGGK